MRPIIVTSPTGEKRRLTPWGILGWRAADIPAAKPGEATKVYAGTMIATVDGQLVGVRETEEQLDYLFELAMSPGRYGNPAITHDPWFNDHAPQPGDDGRRNDHQPAGEPPARTPARKL